MRSPAPSANLLSMAVLAKGAHSPGDAAILAVMKPLMTSFVAQWLGSPDVGVGEKGSRVLGNLLDTDCDARSRGANADAAANHSDSSVVATRESQPPGQGLMWRRVFQDRDIYGLILSYCSSHQTSPTLDERQRTLAQGRLLRILPRLAALNLTAVTRSEFVDLHQQFSAAAAGGGGNSGNSGNIGLLHFAALHMIDKEDALMHLCLIDFFNELISTQATLPYSAHRVETLKALVQEATADDPQLRDALSTLPQRTVPEEAEELERFLRLIL